MNFLLIFDDELNNFGKINLGTSSAKVLIFSKVI